MKHKTAPANFYSGQPNDHHLFQQSFTGIISQSHEIARFTSVYGWGIAYININNESLNNCCFEIENAAMRMKNGAWINIPGNANYVSEEFEKYSEAIREDNLKLAVWLSLKNPEPGQPKVSHSIEEVRPFIVKEEKIEDDNEVYNEEYIQLKLLDPQIFFGNPPQGNYESLKIGEIALASDNDTILFNESYIPPILKIGASNHFIENLNEFVTHIINKANTAQTEITQLSVNKKFDTTKLATYFRLNSLAESGLVLKQMKAVKETPPIQIYYELVRLCGKLSVSSPQTPLNTVPKYDHGDLKNIFNYLYSLIKNMIQGIVIIKYIDIDFKKISSNKLSCEIKREWLKSVNQIFISVEIDSIQDEDLILNQNKIKIVPLSEIDNIRIDKFSGLSFRRISDVPLDLVSDDNKRRFYKFDISKDQDRQWWNRLKSEPLGVLVIGAKVPKLRLHVLSENKGGN